jgi:MFS family permease
MTSTLSKNPQRFVLFSVFFSARAYYPVLAVLFLDLGLTLEQFVLLNMVWALCIVLFEVPSGALADTFGRRRLLLAASALMALEMLCLLLAPRQGGTTLLLLCLLNRICSGLSEACASGADEALAYDSLPEQERDAAWQTLLAKALRWRALGFVVAMLLGGFLYDAAAINRLLPEALAVSTDLAMRLPVLLVFLQSLVCLALCWRMVEPPGRPPQGKWRQVLSLTAETAAWLVRHPSLWAVVLMGVFLDALVRNFATINSSYYRLIELPEWSFGLVGALVGVLGWYVPSLAQAAQRHLSTWGQFAALMLVTALSFIALAQAWPYWGLLPALVLFALLGALGFVLSTLLHQAADSQRRATLLSVKGLLFNLGYGLASLGFASLLAAMPQTHPESQLQAALLWQLPLVLIGGLALLAWAYKPLQAASHWRAENKPKP